MGYFILVIHAQINYKDNCDLIPHTIENVNLGEIFCMGVLSSGGIATRHFILEA